MSLYTQNYPNEARDEQLQAETGVSKGYKIEGVSMPTITLEVSQGATAGSSPASVSGPLRQPLDVVITNPEQNFRTQFVTEAVEHSPGAFNQ